MPYSDIISLCFFGDDQIVFFVLTSSRLVIVNSVMRAAMGVKLCIGIRPTKPVVMLPRVMMMPPCKQAAEPANSLNGVKHKVIAFGRMMPIASVLMTNGVTKLNSDREPLKSRPHNMVALMPNNPMPR